MSNTADTAIDWATLTAKDWSWVERSVWTGTMLNTLITRGKEQVWYSLMDKVYRPETLVAAHKRVSRNRGAAGVDNMTIDRYNKNLAHHQATLHQQLKDGTYQPQAVRRTYISKPGSKETRTLGIPCVRDRIVQTALKQVLEPVFEATFADCSYGFRPGRSCKDALREVDRLLEDGYRYVVDADIQGFFDAIDRSLLLERVRQRVSDGSVLSLVDASLKQDVMDGLRLWTPDEGTPQGAVISPVLANVFLNEFDHLLSERGYQLVRYADDFVILCSSQEEAQDGLDLVRDWTEANHLTLHPTKTHIANLHEPGGEFSFLGFRFKCHQNKRGEVKLHRFVARKSLKKVKTRIRELTPRKHGGSLESILTVLNRSMRGWFNYFSCASRYEHESLDGFIRRRLRRLLRKRSKRGRGSGSSEGDHDRWTNAFFEAHGYYSLVSAHAAMVQSLRGTQ